ncbi:MAG: hypothetical protein BroJett040_23620 [Oligoflexia bacterium]|nr:MAG: hypothetical protein BroJett040_23620 [Oligoflexia bacterium]
MKNSIPYFVCCFTLFILSSISSVAKTVVPDRPTLIVVHAQDTFDEDRQAKSQIDRYISHFKQSQNPVLFLSRSKRDLFDPSNFQEKWYTEDQNPTFKFESAGGEYTAQIQHPEVYITGGYFILSENGFACAVTAMSHTINNYFIHAKGTQKLTIHLPIFALYHEPDEMGLALEIKALLKKDPKRFMTFVRDRYEILFVKIDDEKNYQLKTGYESWKLVNGNPQPSRMIIPPDTKNYTFTLQVDGDTFEIMGVGSRQVVLNFKTDKLQ